MILVRIDNRLIHGQIIEAWLPYTGARTLIVANDELAHDVLQQEIMSLAIPQTVNSSFVIVENVAQALSSLNADDGTEALVLFSSCVDARRAFDSGFGFAVLNIGNVHYKPGKRQVSPSVALSDEDESCLRHLSRKGVELDFRCVPNDPIQVRF
ncbi:PTS sugar transporter subunit IIB [Pseudodesulfovibrio sp. S3]|uniref:PTS sugar transporter subunit IIB n=1 Tax=unclassified Pseudodesulfovibrio TaxID=2661612 RepID=UPI000FEC0D6E|nr:PTS sugar transporter subunit IIB [Pseudodesulfovibrio sp. S3]MCJ2163912.1 PTS sugar transporter subunit IIB [Pseudodesulfovibrio sp. S3-i]RWU05843.1 PTS mannose/fructose/sorbose transporter subunit IIB [Pseudodesulfovibrio sp. S3]